MWKILIADDEPCIREGLRDVISSMDIEVKEFLEAKNGIQAFEKIKENLPDIVLADISMPKLNGIELIEKIRLENVDCEVIIITGYEEFNYAKQSIQLNVLSYLLKPIDLDELHHSLKKAIKRIEERRKSNSLKELLLDQLEKNKDYLRERFFRDVFEENLTDEEIEKQSQILDLELSKEMAFIYVSTNLSTDYGIDIGIDDRLICYSISNVLRKELIAFSPNYIFSDKYRNIVLIIPNRIDEIKLLITIIKNKIEAITKKQISIESSKCSKLNISDTYNCLKDKILKNSACKPIVQSAKRYIIENYHNQNLDLVSVAYAANSNPSYLSRMMKHEIGLSFKDFLTKLRINKALELIRENQLNFNEIAENVGYSSQHYFSTAFKNFTGMSPSEYKKGIVKDKGEM